MFNFRIVFNYYFLKFFTVFTAQMLWNKVRLYRAVIKVKGCSDILPRLKPSNMKMFRALKIRSQQKHSFCGVKTFSFNSFQKSEIFDCPKLLRSFAGFQKCFVFLMFAEQSSATAKNENFSHAPKDRRFFEGILRQRKRKFSHASNMKCLMKCLKAKHRVFGLENI
jgi:hypothetical protein